MKEKEWLKDCAKRSRIDEKSKKKRIWDWEK